ncbi:hypothetical protein AAVH_32166, partial [Aphelenchoides avenae]
MVPLVGLFLLALGVADVTAVSPFNARVGAEGAATCNHHGFDQDGHDNGNVSIVHRRY